MEVPWPAQIRGMPSPQVGEGVAGDEDIPEGGQGPPRQGAGGLDRLRHHRQVHRALPQGGEGAGGAGVDDMEADAGMPGVEGPHGVDQQAAHGDLRGAKAHRAALQAQSAGQGGLRLLQLGAGRRGQPVEQFPLRRQGDATAGAGKEGAAQLLLQVGDDMAHGRLAAHQLLSSPAEAAPAGGAAEHAVVVVADHGASSPDGGSLPGLSKNQNAFQMQQKAKTQPQAFPVLFLTSSMP